MRHRRLQAERALRRHLRRLLLAREGLGEVAQPPLVPRPRHRVPLVGAFLITIIGREPRPHIEAAGAGVEPHRAQQHEHALRAVAAAAAARARARRERRARALARGADVSAIPGGFDYAGTPLHYAALRGRRDTVDRLLAAGADPSIRDAKVGTRPEDWAAHDGHGELAAYLVARREG